MVEGPKTIELTYKGDQKLSTVFSPDVRHFLLLQYPQAVFHRKNFFSHAQ